MKNLLGFEDRAVTSFCHRSDLSFASLVSGFDGDLETLAPVEVCPMSITLFEQGALPQDVYFIEEGLIKLNRIERDGQKLIIGLISTGWLIGAASVIIQRLHPVSAVTLTPCYLRRLPARKLRSLLRVNSELSWHLLQMYSREHFDQIIHVSQLGCLSARQRLEQLLWELTSAIDADGRRREVRIVLPLKLGEIADLIAVTQEHVSRLMRQLQNEGIVRKEKNHILVCNLERLRYSTD